MLLKWCWLHQDVIKMMSDTSVRSPEEAIYSSKFTYLRSSLTFSLGGWEAWGGQKVKRASDRAIGSKQMTNTSSIKADSTSK